MPLQYGVDRPVIPACSSGTGLFEQGLRFIERRVLTFLSPSRFFYLYSNHMRTILGARSSLLQCGSERVPYIRLLYKKQQALDSLDSYLA
jgi:hypothetical protein